MISDNELQRIQNTDWLGAADTREAIMLWRRNEKGQRQIAYVNDYHFCFWIRADDLSTCKKFLQEYQRQGLIYNGKMELPWVRISCPNRRGHDNPRDIIVDKLTALGIPTFESDLQNWIRFCIDNNIQVATNHRIAYFDIETRDDQGPIEIGRDQIVSMAVSDAQGTRIFICEDEEPMLLRKAFDVLNSYDLIISYNGLKFDYPYLEARAKRYGLKGFGKSTIHIDLYRRFERTLFRYGPFQAYYKIRSWRLDDVAMAVTGRGKIPRDEQTIWQLYLTNRELLKQYNIRDTELTMDLDHALHITEVIQLESTSTHRMITGTPTVGQTLDFYIIREANSVNIHYPTQTYQTVTETDEIAGGFVLAAKPGLYENVYVYDYSTMYPNIIMNWNIGPETFVDIPGPDDNKTVTGHGFVKQTGVFARSIRMWLDARAKFKMTIRSAADPDSFESKNASMGESIIKELSNSMFGIFAHQKGRYYKKEIAESITLTGQWLLKQTIAYFEAHGGIVVSADTDGLFVKMPLDSNPHAIRDAFEAALPDQLKALYNLDNAVFNIKHEHTYARFLVVNKKNYAGLVSDVGGKPGIYIRGLQAIKRDTVPIAAEAQQRLLEMIILETADLQQLRAFIETWRQRIMTENIPPEKLILYQRVAQEHYSASHPPLHVRVAAEYRRDGMELFSSQEVRFIVTGHNPILSAVPWYKYDQSVHQWDKTYYWSNRIYSALQRVLMAVYPEYPWSVYQKLSEETQGVLL